MADFHFLRPAWLLAALPLIFVFWYLLQLPLKRSGWQKLIPEHLCQNLLTGSESKASTLPYYLLLLGWLIACVALAGPTWEKRQQPVFESANGKVILVDMSLSMRSTDIKPDRLTRSRYKVIDIANSINQGDTGLVAYAGDAFTISPLTPDNKNLLNLVPSLSPELMPVKGSDPLLGLEQAASLLKNAGYLEGDIFWITDGVDASQLPDLYQFIEQSPYRLLTIGVGTAQGAPIKTEDGALLKDHRGAIVIPKLDGKLLQQLSLASGGFYVDTTASDRDIKALMQHQKISNELKESEKNQEFGDAWIDAGSYLVWLIIPFALYAFRRGVLVSIGLVALYLPISPEVIANEAQEETVNHSFWQSLWQTKNQRAQQAFEQGDYQQAQQLFEEKKWQAASDFKQGNYQAALDKLAPYQDAESLYNKANAQVNLGDLDSAIDNYQQALKKQPNFDAAKRNLAMAQQLKQQQEQQQNQEGQQDQNSGENQDQQASEQQDGQSGQQQGTQQDGQQQESEQGEQGTDESNSQQSDKAESEQSQSEAQQRAEQEAGDLSEQAKEAAEQTENEQQTAKNEALEQAQQDAEQAQQMAEQQTQQNDEAKQDGEQVQQAIQELDELSEEEKAQMQKMKAIMNQVDGDPAFLLKRKMLLESQKRNQTRQPRGVNQEW
ncbi:VWA domain-containing protein [Catenovulum sp. SM1970]|uniref:vWA domain-containing protein n=1 Tax=Marinifaba aquimaris TaxID=2741323 RepID=UPI0015744095|nr:VWA domain-containing protein [Marinifaba aquimaris]NTS77845.1 VWA domain-containing protein [Marinifaba aquimaris]